jgi:endonuclease/exonuclease/phosphatase family metal-dependent hydrolase
MRCLSWNVLSRHGAGAADVARLVAATDPDLVLLQEATAVLDDLPERIGGTYHRAVLPPRQNGPAVWSRRPVQVEQVVLPVATRLDLPVPVLRLVAPRVALVVRMDDIRIANVHLDHGQRANRRQLRHILAEYPTLDAIVGDFNALGPTRLADFTDVGPRRPTHRMYGLVPLRLDRCLLRHLRCVRSRALAYGPSDHRPILLDLQPCSAPGQVRRA